MSKQHRRWWIGVALTACMAVAPAVFAAPGPGTGAAPAVIAKWVQDEADLLDIPGISADKAAVIRDELTAVFTSGRPVPTAYRQEMAKACKESLRPIILHPKEPLAAIDALIVLYEIEHFDTDDTLLAALGNKSSSPAVRYWAAKDLIHILPQYKGGVNPAPIFEQTTRPGGFLPVEKDPLVRAELANIVGGIGNPAAFPAGLAALTQAMDTTNDELYLKKYPVTKAYTDCATAIMDNMAILIKAKAVPVVPAIEAATKELKTTAEHVKTHNDKSPEDPAVLEGLRLQYKSYQALIKVTPGMKGVVLPPEPAGNMDPVKDPPKLFSAIDTAIANVNKATATKPDAATKPATAP